MVTRHTINRLSSRIGELEGRLVLAPRVEYRVALRFTDQPHVSLLMMKSRPENHQKRWPGWVQDG